MLTAYIIARKTEQNLTNQQLSNLSGIPKGTVDRILAKDDDSCNLSTAVALIKAVGGSLDDAMGIETDFPDLPPDPPDNPVESLNIVRDVTRSWWSALSAINREKNAAYADSLKSRDRWLLFSVFINCAFILWLIYDLMHPTRGWIQYDVSSVQHIHQGFSGAVAICSIWWSRFV